MQNTASALGILIAGEHRATTMTYEINGKQYLVIAADGHDKLRRK